MATPTINPEYEAKKEKAKKLIAAGGCHALSYWSRTDAERLLPKGYELLEPLDPPTYITDWEKEAKKAIDLIQQALDILQEPQESEDLAEELVSGVTGLSTFGSRINWVKSNYIITRKK